MTIDFRATQLKKALSPMDVTLLGMLIEVRALQLKKAHLSITVTLLGMVINSMIFLHNENAKAQINVKVLGIINDLRAK